MRILKQSTSVDIGVGPFLDDSDGVMAMTALTITQPDVRLKKNAGSWAQKAAAQTLTHEEAGWYEVTLDATDTDTVGQLIVAISESGALPVWEYCQVVEEAVYDALFAASALGYIANAPVNVAQISGDSAAADNLEVAYDDSPGAVPWVGIIDQGTAQSVGATDIVLRTAASFIDDGLIGCTVVITNGTQVGSRSIITDYVSATDTATLAGGWTGATPSGSPTYQIWGSAAGADITGQLDDIETKIDTVDTVVDSILADTVEIGAAGAGLTNINLPNQTMDIIGNITGNLSGSVGSVTGAVGSVTGAVGSVTGAVGSIAANGLSASSLAADAVDEILDDTIGDGTITVRQALRILIAGMAGKLSGAETTTVTIRNTADSANVIVATVDADGNRSAVTVTP